MLYMLWPALGYVAVNINPKSVTVSCKYEDGSRLQYPSAYTQLCTVWLWAPKLCLSNLRSHVCIALLVIPLPFFTLCISCLCYYLALFILFTSYNGLPIHWTPYSTLSAPLHNSFQLVLVPFKYISLPLSPIVAATCSFSCAPNMATWL